MIAHCPDEYNRIEIEEVESGRRLTARDSDSADFFHSRLQISSDGRYLLSAGWVWHPWSSLKLFDLTQAIRDPQTLDGPGLIEGFEIANVEVEAYSTRRRTTRRSVPRKRASGRLPTTGG